MTFHWILMEVEEKLKRNFLPRQQQITPLCTVANRQYKFITILVCSVWDSNSVYLTFHQRYSVVVASVYFLEFCIQHDKTKRWANIYATLKQWWEIQTILKRLLPLFSLLLSLLLFMPLLTVPMSTLTIWFIILAFINSTVCHQCWSIIVFNRLSFSFDVNWVHCSK